MAKCNKVFKIQSVVTNNLQQKWGYYKFFMSSGNFIIAQILGLTATLILCLSYTVKNKKTFLLLSFFGETVYGLSFIFVNSLGTGLIALLSCLQSICFYFYDT